jgi:hypothetical protein
MTSAMWCSCRAIFASNKEFIGHQCFNSEAIRMESQSDFDLLNDSFNAASLEPSLNIDVELHQPISTDMQAFAYYDKSRFHDYLEPADTEAHFSHNTSHFMASQLPFLPNDHVTSL